MPFPGSGNDDGVDTAGGQQVAIRVGATGVDLRSGLAGFFYNIVGGLEHGCVHVADGDNVDVRPAESEGEVALPAEAGTDDGEAHAVGRARRFRRTSENRRLEGDTCGCKRDISDEVAAGAGHSSRFLST